MKATCAGLLTFGSHIQKAWSRRAPTGSRSTSRLGGNVSGEEMAWLFNLATGREGQTRLPHLLRQSVRRRHLGLRDGVQSRLRVADRRGEFGAAAPARTDRHGHGLRVVSRPGGRGRWTDGHPAKDSAYPATRLAGEPLSPKSQIDYLIASRHQVGKHGLFGQEVTAEQAVVHHHLADGDWHYFRRVFSDDFPVTTCVAVIPDDDQSRSDDGTSSAMVCVMGRRLAASPTEDVSTEDVLTVATPRATVRRQL